MCGIAGLVELTPGGVADEAGVRRMTEVLRHRGPDDEGVWVDGPVGLGSRRLAIIDLSPRAHQPMANEDRSLRITFNGEVYNFQELRRRVEAKGHVFVSDSDTEAILHLYEEEGVDCLRHLRGMFAFAIWDGPRRRLFVARDRLGKKPLYYYHDERAFLFGSEAKSILVDPRVPAEPDGLGIHHYLTYGYVPAPWSAFRGIRKLPPAHYLVLEGGRVSVHRYWSLRYTPKRTEPEPVLAEELLTLLQEAVRLRLISDVPLGALLSGGIDSSVVVAMMRRFIAGRLSTFSIGFDQPQYDELAYARRVAQHFGTDHHEVVVKSNAIRVLPKLVWHYNEPFADSSALPSFALCEMAREHVTVALNGDGGDETFLGYDRYLATAIAGWQDRVPEMIRRGLTGLVRTLPIGPPKSTTYRLLRFAEAAELEPRRRYARWVTTFEESDKRILYTADFAAQVMGDDSVALLDAAYAVSDAPSFLEATAHADVLTYLPDDLLVKMDIASMAHSLEVRSPFLDHEVVEFAATLPPGLKLRGLTQKHLVKRVMRGVLPDAVLQRKKMGFGVPIDHWFRYELRDLAHDVLLSSKARGRGYFRSAEIQRLLDEHVAGRAYHHARLWCLLMLELWHRTFVDQGCPPDAPGTL